MRYRYPGVLSSDNERVVRQRVKGVVHIPCGPELATPGLTPRKEGEARAELLPDPHK
jgi:hypothetical protein